MQQSILCDFSDVYIVVKGTISLTKPNRREIIDIRSRFLAFKNNAPFTNCITKINNVLIDNAEDLDVVTPVYNLTGYSKKYRKTKGSLWNYYRVLQEKHKMQIKKPVKTLSNKKKRLRKILKWFFP